MWCSGAERRLSGTAHVLGAYNTQASFMIIWRSTSLMILCHTSMGACWCREGSQQEEGGWKAVWEGG